MSLLKLRFEDIIIQLSVVFHVLAYKSAAGNLEFASKQIQKQKQGHELQSAAKKKSQHSHHNRAEAHAASKIYAA